MKILISLTLILLCITFVSAEINSSYLCEKTYYGIISEKTEYEIINQIELEKEVGLSKEIVRDYIQNWNDNCRDITLRLLDYEEFCNKLYNFVVKNRWSFTEYSITKYFDMKYDIISNYLNNFNEFCGYDLPQRGENKLILYEKTKCELDNKLFGSSIPFFIISVNKTCENLGPLKYIFRIENDIYGLNITGIRIYFVSLILLFIFIISILIIKKNTKKILKQ